MSHAKQTSNFRIISIVHFKDSKIITRNKVDWCEENYVVISYIAEFWNTVSNILFLIIPPIMINRFRDYEAELGMPIRYVWLLLMTVGIGSIYFHATLSLAGQLGSWDL